MKTYDELKALIEQRGVHAVFGEPGEGWAIEQNSAELAEFLVEMQDIGVGERVLEIGTGYKGGLSRFLGSEMGWNVWSIDPTQYPFNFDHVTYIAGEENIAEFARDHQPEYDFDLVIIDGDHTYEAVKADHERWGEMATKVVAFHDIAGLRDCEGVRDYWNDIAWQRKMLAKTELKTTTTADLKPGYHEIIAEGDPRGGIGYVVLAEMEAPTEEPLMSPEVIAKIRQNMKEPPPAKKPAPRKPAAKKAPVKK